MVVRGHRTVFDRRERIVLAVGELRGTKLRETAVRDHDAGPDGLAGAEGHVDLAPPEQNRADLRAHLTPPIARIFFTRLFSSWSNTSTAFDSSVMNASFLMTVNFGATGIPRW